ncbi:MULTISPECIES: branched-chain amino acid aminotransferase [Pedobacter]|uniref:branched-chain-amino-acid transaminase n=1 Tax=Pedobacter heparinus (strain ATCC 13125 / DSM 2366 / CIP 104194 / JCM 7457 / NBRC 12017 / NCIMB 9290 / NRRL B-14731 / HIM 762-3) TaxID=485917 RepID=C6XZ03_PEDHD|nr:MULTISPECIES: branched-chain amino acid aminotransferase [Pedobacter]ACU02485.1 branched-chain amino acid aminotransferase [Pedobacter heparinus DSM 2366]MBB5440172.1 branched-chain amino acid aminotransferase [Pedobacter sp. AK017]
MNDTLDMTITKAEQSRLTVTDFSQLPFGKVFSDHMFIAEFDNGTWGNLQVVPYGPIPMSPAISALHYGQAIFEGMKAYRQANGKISVFRPEKNFERFNKSAVRMSMPEIPKEIFMQGIAALIDIDEKWIPAQDGYSLYIRPVMFATDPYLGVKPSDKYIFALLTTPTGAYYSKALKVKIETEYTRADDGGVGYAKTAGNYARSLYPFAEAQKEGFDQLIWTDAATHEFIEEAGTANLIFVINGKLVTPSVRSTVLDGVTRDTIIQLAKKAGIEVEERRVSVKEVIAGIENGSLTDAFAAGTAATVTPIGEIGYQGKTYKLSDPATRTISAGIAKTLNDIRYGLAPDEFGWNWVV